jgi:hypothetical protein
VGWQIWSSGASWSIDCCSPADLHVVVRQCVPGVSEGKDLGGQHNGTRPGDASDLYSRHPPSMPVCSTTTPHPTHGTGLGLAVGDPPATRPTVIPRT